MPAACLESQRTKRKCAICGTTLTWNPNDICCCCEDKLVRAKGTPTNHRVKIDPSQYHNLIRLRDEEGWTNNRIARLYGVNRNYLSELIGRIRRGEV